jgi:DNA replication protein DnaC
MTSPAPAPIQTATPTQKLPDALRSLGLRRAAADLDDILARSAKARWSATQLLEEVVRAEIHDRARRSLERRLGRSHIGRFKPAADYDWNWPKKIDRKAIERALALDFLDGPRNVIFVANQGLGKTMFSQNIAHAAILRGRSALFTTAAQMLLDLGSQDSARGLDRRLRHYTKPDVLCLDEVGYLSYDARAADLLFQVVSRRYEHKPIVLTTNLVFKEWPTVFPNAACTTALIDRLVHHAEILPIVGESWRRREAERDKRDSE